MQMEQITIALLFMVGRKFKMKPVWQFTNQRKLTKQEFIRYFEKKVKSTIRKYGMPINLIKSNNLKAKVINNIVKELPIKKGKLTSDNLNDVSVGILYIMIYGNEKELEKLKPKNQPLYFLSNKEILLYAKLVGINGELVEKKGKMKGIDAFIIKLEEKNQDIRLNIVNGLLR